MFLILYVHNDVGNMFKSLITQYFHTVVYYQSRKSMLILHNVIEDLNMLHHYASSAEGK